MVEPGSWLRVGTVCTVITASLVAAVGTALHSESLPYDTILFVRFAREIGQTNTPALIGSEPDLQSSENPVDVIRRYTQHPGQPLLILAAHRLLGLVSSWNEVARWEWSARLVGIVCHGVSVYLAYLLFRSLFGFLPAVVSSGMIGLSPPMLRVASDGLSDAPASALLLLSAVALSRMMVVTLPRYAILGGSAAGAGYWVRPEAVQLGLLSMVLLFVALAIGRTPRLRLGSLILCLGCTLGVFLFPYMTIKSSLLTKKADAVREAFANATKAASQESSTVKKETPATPKSQIVVAGNDPPPDPTHQLGTHSYWRGFRLLFFRWSGLTGHALLLPILLGMALTIRETMRRPDQRLLLLAVVANVIGLPLAVFVLMGYLDVRHAIPLFVLSAGWLWPGCLALCLALRGGISAIVGFWRGRVVDWPIGAIPATAGSILCVLVAVAVAGVTERNNRTLVGYRRAGQWLAKHAKDDERIVDPTYMAPFYAGRDDRNPWPHAGTCRLSLVESLIQEDSRIRWIVASDEWLWAREGRQGIPSQMANARIVEAFSCPMSTDQQMPPHVRVYRVDREVSLDARSRLR